MSRIIYMFQTIQLLNSIDSKHTEDLIKNGTTKQVSDKLIYLVIEETDKQT